MQLSGKKISTSADLFRKECLGSNEARKPSCPAPHIQSFGKMHLCCRGHSPWYLSFKVLALIVCTRVGLVHTPQWGPHLASFEFVDSPSIRSFASSIMMQVPSERSASIFSFYSALNLADFQFGIKRSRRSILFIGLTQNSEAIVQERV